MSWFSLEKYVCHNSWESLYETFEEHSELIKVRKYLYTNKSPSEQAKQIYLMKESMKSMDYIEEIHLMKIKDTFIYDFNRKSDILRYITFKDPDKIESITLEMINNETKQVKTLFHQISGEIPFPLNGLPLIALQFITIRMIIKGKDESLKKCTFIGRWCILDKKSRENYALLPHTIDFGDEIYQVTSGIIMKKKVFDELVLEKPADKLTNSRYKMIQIFSENN